MRQLRVLVRVHGRWSRAGNLPFFLISLLGGHAHAGARDDGK